MKLELKSLVAVTLVMLLTHSSVSSLLAQGPATPKPIKIVILDGRQAVNSIKAKTATQPVVEVRDESERPLSGVEVEFTLPGSGPSGVFPGAARTFKARTNSQGQAAVRGMVPNEEVGRFSITVTAKAGDRTASALIDQSNAPEVIPVVTKKKGGSGGAKWLILAGAAAGIGIAVALAAGGGGSAATPPPPIPSTGTIGVGTITIGGPR